MSGNHRLHWSSPAVRIGIVSGALLALGLVLIGGQLGQAKPADLSPQNVAVVPAKDMLQITVDFAHLKLSDNPATLDMELVSSEGKSLARADVVGLKGRPAHYRWEVPAPKAAASTLKLVCRLSDRKLEVPVARVLLAKAHETALSVSQDFYAGSSAALRCDVHGVRTIAESVPLAGAEVTVTLRVADGKGKTHLLHNGKTGSDGVAEVKFEVPHVAHGSYILAVATRSALGEEKLERQVQVKAESKILLVTDKPLYQPGQTMHIRALALQPFDLKPIPPTDLVFEVEDAKGNKVFKRTHRTSEYGIASVNFDLADEVNMGAYQVRAIMGQQQAQKTVTVKQYVLPKFKVNVTADKSFYLPKETIKAELQTDYFFGKPVANGTVKVTASTFDVAFKAFQTWEGKTDANGHARFEIKLPDYFVGQPLQKGDALARLEVKVTDTADHTETINKTYPVSDQSIRVSLIPESGRLVPGMENLVYAAAIYPDGNPAVCDISLWTGREAKGKPLTTLKTNAAGLAEFKITPKNEQFRGGNWEARTIEMLGGNQPQIWGQRILYDLCAEAKDVKGNVAKTVAEINSEPFGENVILRLNQAIYKDGDTFRADIRTSAGLPTAYLDIIKGGQTLLTRWLNVKDGKASLNLDLPQNVFGTLEVHAYQMLRSGEIVRDSRVVYVQPKNDLKIDVKAEKGVYAPGENGTIHFQITDASGKPTAAALGIIIVDEAVYALQEMQPGLEKVYFTLQEELLKPQVQIAFKPNENINNLVLQPVLPAAKQQVAQVLLTAVRPKPPARWEVAPAQARQQQMDNQIQQIGWALWNHSVNDRPFLQYDKETGSWDFRPGLLKEMVNANFLHVSVTNSPLGGSLSLADLAAIEPGFTSSRLAQTVNNARMQQLLGAFIQYTNRNQKTFLKNGRWSFPKTILRDAATSQGLNDSFLTDVWGLPYGLVRVKTKQNHGTGNSQLDYHQLVSVGPDGEFGTKDDVKVTSINPNIWQQGQWWWLADPSRQVKMQNQQMFFGRGLRRRELMLGMNMDGAMLRNGGGGFGGGGLAPKAAPMAAERFAAAEGKKADKDRDTKSAGPATGGGAGGGAGPPLRVREYFPETLKWEPSIITDDNGRADLVVAFADSITTWRMTASASSKGGSLGSVSAPLRVFQDFFVDLDMPVSLTQNDEVAFPVAVFNYLKKPQTVRLELKKEPWFELTDPEGFVRSLPLKPNEVTSVKFRIKARKIGFHPLEVKAFGTKASDAIRRSIEVVPYGKRIEQVVTDRLSGKVTKTIAIPEHAVPDASKLIVKLYPGVMSQVLEGVEGMIRLPGG
jgi:hypothetical protein